MAGDRRVLAFCYLALVFHTLILLDVETWLHPAGWMVGLLLLGGTLGAFRILFGRFGRPKVTGKLQSLVRYPDLRVVEGRVALEPGWPGHRPGQFAFVTTSAAEGPHPFTIASAWDPADPGLTFIMKGLGDWTDELAEHLREHTPVEVEGPYGHFDFADANPRQIWVGAGIGITPFVAKMKELAREPGGPEVHLFHVTRDVDRTALDELSADADAAGVDLHVTLSREQGRLTPERIRETVPEWKEASVWFCGPAAFGRDSKLVRFAVNTRPANNRRN